MTDPTRILLVDDQRLMREGLRTLLELEDDLSVAGEAENGEQALVQYELLRPNVVMMDIRMPVMDGVEATIRLRERWPDAQVIILPSITSGELTAGAKKMLLPIFLFHLRSPELASIA